MKKYENLLKNTQGDLSRKLIMKNIIAVQNTIADCMLRDYDISNEKDENLLVNASKQIKSIFTYLRITISFVKNHEAIPAWSNWILPTS